MSPKLRHLLTAALLWAMSTRVGLRLFDYYSWVFIEQEPLLAALRHRTRVIGLITHEMARVSYFVNEWVLTTNHRKIAILYFAFVAVSGFTGLVLATIIRLELAYPGQFFLTNNAERYLTVISLHGIVMVFFFVIPTLFGAFGNFLLPTQLGIRDVAFPRLNSFMFWVTPAGFVMLLHILMFDKSYSLTYWINYSETKAQLRRRYDEPQAEALRYHEAAQNSVMAWRFQSMGAASEKTRALLLKEAAPALAATSFDYLSQATAAKNLICSFIQQRANWTTFAGLWCCCEEGLALFSLGSLALSPSTWKLLAPLSPNLCQAPSEASVSFLAPSTVEFMYLLFRPDLALKNLRNAWLWGFFIERPASIFPYVQTQPLFWQAIAYYHPHVVTASAFAAASPLTLSPYFNTLSSREQADILCVSLAPLSLLDYVLPLLDWVQTELEGGYDYVVWPAFYRLLYPYLPFLILHPGYPRDRSFTAAGSLHTIWTDRSLGKILWHMFYPFSEASFWTSRSRPFYFLTDPYLGCLTGDSARLAALAESATLKTYVAAGRDVVTRAERSLIITSSSLLRLLPNVDLVADSISLLYPAGVNFASANSMLSIAAQSALASLAKLANAGLSVALCPDPSDLAANLYAQYASKPASPLQSLVISLAASHGTALSGNMALLAQQIVPYMGATEASRLGCFFNAAFPEIMWVASALRPLTNTQFSLTPFVFESIAVRTGLELARKFNQVFASSAPQLVNPHVALGMEWVNGARGLALSPELWVLAPTRDSFAQTDLTVGALILPGAPYARPYALSSAPSLANTAVVGDLFSAPWELRQLWLANVQSYYGARPQGPDFFTLLNKAVRKVRWVSGLSVPEATGLMPALMQHLVTPNWTTAEAFRYVRTLSLTWSNIPSPVALYALESIDYAEEWVLLLEGFWGGLKAFGTQLTASLIWVYFFVILPQGYTMAPQVSTSAALLSLSTPFDFSSGLGASALDATWAGLALSAETLAAEKALASKLYAPTFLNRDAARNILTDEAIAALGDVVSLFKTTLLGDAKGVKAAMPAGAERLALQTQVKLWRREAHLNVVLNPNKWATDTLFGVAWPSTAVARPTLPQLASFARRGTLAGFRKQAAFYPTTDATSSALYGLSWPKKPFKGLASYRHIQQLAAGYCLSLWRVDLLNDWRELKLEREVWRSIDTLAGARNHLLFKKKYYSNFYEPGSLVNKVSTWLPNHLLPGWAFVTPYSSRLRYTALGKVDVALVVVFAASLGSIFSSVNYVITYRYIGAPTLKNRRELRSFFVDALLVASRMMILANPALMVGILLLLSDRHFNTSVFDFSGGGDTILFQHLFWFFGHPEVYIIIIPCFGIVNSLLPYYLKKRLSGRLSLQFSMYTIAYMSFAVWGHHMYMVGLANSARTLYSTMTVMISVPASTKVIHWCVTLIESTLTLDVGFLFLLSFMYFFVLGGLSGMFVAHIGFDTIFHDTFYVIGHFHVMFAGAAVCCIFAAFYFYFPAIFGVRYSKFFAYLHYGFYMAGQLLTLIPMFWLGYSGMPRRIMDYPSSFGGWHSVISSGHILTVISFIFFLAMLADSFYEGRAPVTKTKGVSRLNTRLAFYLYESRKLQAYQTKALPLLRHTSAKRANRGDLYKFCWQAEMTNFEYVFDSKGVRR